MKYSRRNIDGIKDCFKSILRSFNADQPLNDLLEEVDSYTSKKSRSMAPYTPRIIILGPTGSGRKTVAMQISRKYDLPIGKTLLVRIILSMEFVFLSSSFNSNSDQTTAS